MWGRDGLTLVSFLKPILNWNSHSVPGENFSCFCRAIMLSIKQGMVIVNTWVFILRRYKWHIHAGSWSLVNCWREGSTLPYKGCSWILMNAAVGHMDGSALMVIGVSAWYPDSFHIEFPQTMFSLTSHITFNLLTHLQHFQIRPPTMTKWGIWFRHQFYHRTFDCNFFEMFSLTNYHDIESLSSTLHGINRHFIYPPTSNVKNWSIDH